MNVTILERNAVVSDATGRWFATKCHLAQGEVQIDFAMDQALVNAWGEERTITHYLDKFRKAGLSI